MLELVQAKRMQQPSIILKGLQQQLQKERIKQL